MKAEANENDELEWLKDEGGAQANCRWFDASVNW